MADLRHTFSLISKVKVLVIGDVMIDTYISGDVNRISPEAPVPVVRFKSRESRLGGAANVALNVKALGAEPVICSVIGKDPEAKCFLHLAKTAGLTSKGILSSSSRTTSVKTRVIGNNQQLVRIDHERIEPLAISDEKRLIAKVTKLIQSGKFATVIFEDYNKGILTENVIRTIIRLSVKYKILTAADPKRDNFAAYAGVTLFKPNLKELREGIGRDVNAANPAEVYKAAEELNNKIKAKFMLVTLSEHGVLVMNGKKSYILPAHHRNIADVSGAGDTVISVATLCMAGGMKFEHAADLANLAGGLVCEEPGVVPVKKSRLLKEALNY